MACSGVCHQVSLRLGPTVFSVDLYVIPFHGADLILGVAWLQKLGKVTFDYLRRSLLFPVQESVQTIVGLPLSSARATSGDVRRLAADHSNHLFYLKISAEPDQLTTEFQATDEPTLHPAVELILDQFKQSFSVPDGLPLICDSDHQIIFLV